MRNAEFEMRRFTNPQVRSAEFELWSEGCSPRGADCFTGSYAHCEAGLPAFRRLFLWRVQPAGSTEGKAYRSDLARL